jgi:hypothetical protein
MTTAAFWSTTSTIPKTSSGGCRRRLSAEGRDEPGEVALARVLTRSGRWVVLHGAMLVSDGQRRIAVIVEPAHPARIGPLLMGKVFFSYYEPRVRDNESRVPERKPLRGGPMVHH